MTHPNDMSAWPEIRCQRDHHAHTAITVDVDLARPHGYHDLPAVPPRLARAWRMRIYDPDKYPVDDGPYCAAHDAVSATITNQGIWEPAGTIMASQVCSTADPTQIVVDLGAQIGWFSLIAAAWGLLVRAYDADATNLRLLRESARLNGWTDLIKAKHLRIDATTKPILKPQPIRLAKIDTEGAEGDAVRVLWPVIEAGLVDHLLVELSPTFRPGAHYPDLASRLLAAGFDAYQLPPKQQPPACLDDPDRDLKPLSESELREIAGREGHQEDVWFKRRDASW